MVLLQEKGGEEMSSDELAKKCSVQVRTVYNWVKAGCPHDYIQRGRRLVLEFDYRAVAKWLKEAK